MITEIAIAPTKSPAGPGSNAIGMIASAVVTVDASSGTGEALDRRGDGIEPRMAPLQAAANVIRHDDAGIDEQPQCHDQAGHRHLVDRDAGGTQACKGDEGRQRQNDGDDQRCAPAEREKQNRDDQADTDREVLQDAAQAFVRIGALVEQGAQFETRREVAAEILVGGVDLPDPRIDLKVVLHARRDDHRRAAVGKSDARARLAHGLAHFGDVGNADNAAIAGFEHGNSSDTFQRFDFAGDFDQELAHFATDLAGADLAVGTRDRRRYLVCRQADRCQLHAIDGDQDLFFLGPVEAHISCA